MNGFPALPKAIMASVLGLTSVLVCPAGAEEESPSASEWHRFQDKQGQEVEARVLSLSSDWRQVRIERRDGNAFELLVTRLSLDDQQYLRTWLLSQPAPDPTELRFDLTVKKQEGQKERTELNSPANQAVWQHHEIGYELSVTSLARTPVSDLQLEYFLLMEDAVQVSATAPADEASPRWRTNRNAPIRYQRGSIALPPLVFNRPQEVDTKTLIRDSVSAGRSNRINHEDRVVGVVARLVTSQGTPIVDAMELNRGFAHLSWETLVAMQDPSESNGKGVLTKAVASN